MFMREARLIIAVVIVFVVVNEALVLYAWLHDGMRLALLGSIVLDLSFIPVISILTRRNYVVEFWHRSLDWYRSFGIPNEVTAAFVSVFSTVVSGFSSAYFVIQHCNDLFSGWTYFGMMLSALLFVASILNTFYWVPECFKEKEASVSE